MGNRLLHMTILALALALLPGRPAGAEVLRLTTLQWPPYTGVGVPRLGTMTAVVSGAAARVGDRLELRILPWKRAVRTGEQAPGYAGYFPLYWTPERAERCHLSAPIGTSPLGFAEPADAPLSWTSPDDLAPYRLGTVEGYANTATFDRLAADGVLRVEPVVDDVTNLRKVVAGRIDGAVIDAMVMDYLVATTPDLKASADALAFNERLLEEKTLHVCFRRTPQGKAQRDRFNEGLKKINAAATIAEVMDRVRLQTTDWLAEERVRP